MAYDDISLSLERSMILGANSNSECSKLLVQTSAFTYNFKLGFWRSNNAIPFMCLGFVLFEQINANLYVCCVAVYSQNKVNK